MIVVYIFLHIAGKKIPVIGRAVPGTYRSLCFSAEINVILSTIYFGEAGDDIPTIVGIQINGEFIFFRSFGGDDDTKKQFRSLLNGVLVQDRDLKTETRDDLKQVSEKAPSDAEIDDMLFANKIVKQSKSNAIVLAKGKQLVASGVGQTSRVDALKQAIEKAKSFGFDLNGAVMASDAFFPFPDCVELADKEGIKAVIQPGGSVKDELTFQYCNEHGVAMVITGVRHFKH